MFDRFVSRTIKLAEWIVVLGATLIISYLAISAWGNAFDADTSIPLKDNWFTHFVIMGIVIFVFFGISFLNRKPQLGNWVVRVLFICAFLFIGRMCWSFVVQTLIQPEGDTLACMKIAIWFYESDFRAVAPKDSYLSLWPFQTGFVFILEKTMRLLGETGPLLFQKINCLYVLFMYVTGYGIVCAITKRVECKIAYVLATVTYSPILFSVTEVYGDLPAYAWIMFSSLCFIYWSKGKKYPWIWLLLFNGGIVFACVYKRNCLIHAIAFLLVFLVMQLRKKQVLYTIVTIIMFIIAVLGTNITTKYYEIYAQNTCGKGVPAIAFIAMGLQYDSGGGWNGFHSDTYIQTGYDNKETVRISKESIADSIEVFKDNPSFCMEFFHNKVLVQWANATHGVFWGLGNVFDVNRNPEAYWVYYLYGEKYHRMVPFMDIHQSIIYGILFLSSIILLIGLVKKENMKLEYLVSYVALIGGFLFSLIWEAQTGAVMYYLILLLPIAIGVIGTHMEKISKKINS